MTSVQDRLAELRARLSPEKQAELAERLKGKPAAPGRLTSRPAGAPPVLSFAQERLWFLEQLHPGRAAYNISLALGLDGDLDLPALLAALGAVLRRHEVLRTRVADEGGEPRPVTAAATASPEAATGLVDLSTLPAGRRHEEALALTNDEAVRPFDLARGPILRLVLLRLGPSRHAGLLTVHHLAADGWSLGLLVREMTELYAAVRESRPARLPDLALQYADVAWWERHRWQEGRLAADLEFWRGRLGGDVSVLELPFDRPRPAEPRVAGEVEPISLPARLGPRLEELARREEVTPFTFVVGVLAVLLGRLSGQERFLLGTPVANRRARETEDLIGLFVNTVAVTVDLTGRPTFRELLGRLRREMTAAFAHQELPFERLVAELHPARDLARSPLFDVLVTFENAPLSRLVLPGLTVGSLAGRVGRAQFDLSLILIETGEGLEALWDFDRLLLDRSTVARWAVALASLLEGALEDPSTAVESLPVLSPEESHQLGIEWNDTARERPAGLGLHHLVEAQADRTPEAVALVFAGSALTYGEMEARANRLAHALAAAGVGPEAAVGISLERSLDLAVALLAALKAGGAWVPLEPTYPAERLRELAAEAGCRAVVCRPGQAAVFPAPATVVDPQAKGPDTRRPAAWISDTQLAYVIFTSGSTGRPKGGMNAHRGIVNRLLWTQEHFGLTPRDRVLQKTPMSFDVSVWELFWPLLAGAALVLAEPGVHREPEALTALIQDEQITTLHFVPSMLDAWLDVREVPSCSSLARVLASGEALPAELAKKFTERIDAPLFNLYGPTEAAVDVTVWPAAPGEDPLPIGRPVAHTRLHVLGFDGRPVPMKAHGELLLGGVQVGRGYLVRPDLTAERFVPDPFGTEGGGRLYRTGDLVRTRADGAIEYLGRLDHQVKVRGFRIELGEIEARLARHPAVARAAVVAHGTGAGRTLAAFVTAAGAAPVERELLDDLRRSLPDFMVPARLAVLPELPLSPNGKLDRKALAAWSFTSTAEDGGRPENATEEIVAALFADLLGLPRAGVEQSFFDLGGHSLLATRLVARIRETLGAGLPVRAVFSAPTPRELARQVALAAGRPAAGRIERTPRDRPLPLSFAQERLWTLDRLGAAGAAYNIPSALRLHGELSPPRLEHAFAEVVRRHEILRTGYGLLDGEPVQQVEEAADWTLPRVDLSGLPEALRVDTARGLAGEIAAHPFDLTRAPLLATVLLLLGADDQVLVVVVHHIAADGWSLGLLVDELARLYEGKTPLPALLVQYADYALWQRGRISPEHIARELDFWRETLTGTPPLTLPSDHPRPPVQGFRGHLVPFHLPGMLPPLTALARSAGATLFMTLLAALAALLARLSGQRDFAVGTPFADRERPEVQPLIGLFLNLLALRLDLSGPSFPSFRELVTRARSTALAAYTHPDVPFERVVEAVRPNRDPGRPPVFQVMFTWEDVGERPSPPRSPSPETGEGEVPRSDPVWEPFPFESRSAKFDLLVILAPEGDGITGSFEVDAGLFEATTGERWVHHLARLLEQATARPGVPIDSLPWWEEVEQEELEALASVLDDLSEIELARLLGEMR